MNICLPTKKNGLVVSGGFSLIELLVVISLFALVAVVISVSYLGFETREQVKNGALQLKTDLRLAQNKAKTGDKISNNPSGCSSTNGSGSATTISTNSLAGWYIKFDTAADTQYVIGGICLNSVSSLETPFGQRTIKLPKGVRIESFVCACGGSNIEFNTEGTPGIASVFFKPTTYLVSFHNSKATDGVSPLPPYNFTNTVESEMNSAATALTIKIVSTDGGGNSYNVKVSRYGDIVETRL